MESWLEKLQPYIGEWVNATTTVWPGNEPYQRDDFDAYLRTYRQSTRLRLVQTTQPDQMPPPSITDMYPLEAIGGSRNYAVRTLFLLLNVRINNHILFLLLNYAVRTLLCLSITGRDDRRHSERRCCLYPAAAAGALVQAS